MMRVVWPLSWSLRHGNLREAWIRPFNFVVIPTEHNMNAKAVESNLGISKEPALRYKLMIYEFCRSKAFVWCAIGKNICWWKTEVTHNSTICFFKSYGYVLLLCIVYKILISRKEDRIFYGYFRHFECQNGLRVWLCKSVKGSGINFHWIPTEEGDRYPL